MSSPEPPVDRSAPPPPGELRPLRFPTFERRRIPDGPTLLVLRRTDTPLVVLEMLADGGAENDPADLAGLANLTGALLSEGSGELSSTDIAGRIERLGGRLDTGADWDCSYGATTLPAEHLAAGLDLLASVMTRPSLPREEFDRVRRHRLTEAVRRRDQPASLAGQRLAWAIYGDHVYGRPLTGSTETLERIQRKDVETFYHRHLRLDRCVLIAAGDVEADALAEMWMAAGEAAEAAADSHAEAGAEELSAELTQGVQVQIVDRPHAAQTELRMGHLGVPRRHPDFTRLRVLNALLGGKFTSRLNLNLREKNGFTYGVASRFTGRRGPGPFSIGAAVATDVAGAATREVLHELRRLREEPPAAAELADTQSYLIGTFPYSLQTIHGLADKLELLALHGLPDDYYEHLPGEIAAVTPDDVLQMARQHLHPDRLAIVAVGPAESLRPQLEELGPVTVVDADWL